jgi:hypothetical protein
VLMRMLGDPDVAVNALMDDSMFGSHR